MIATEKRPVQQKPAPSLKHQRDKDREMVKGIFRYYELPGGTFEFCFKAYKEDGLQFYKLTDNQVYTLPLGVARHLNKNCCYPEYERFNEGQGIGYVQRVTRKVHRVGFQSLEFVEIDDMPMPGEKEVVLVESL